MAINTLGVLGCGLMGAGIAQVAAGAGFKTVVLEVNASPGLEGIEHTTGVDVASAILEHVERGVAERRNSRPVPATG